MAYRSHPIVLTIFQPMLTTLKKDKSTPNYTKKQKQILLLFVHAFLAEISKTKRVLEQDIYIILLNRRSLTQNNNHQT